MAKKAAVAWIRDGVLVDRMAENAVAFALATFYHIKPELREGICIEELVNWGFEKSGVSAADKMQLFNTGRRDVVKYLHEAAFYYTELTIGIENWLEYFPGAVELLRDVTSSGSKNYITSAAEQSTLDEWKQRSQGGRMAAYLHELFGTKEGFRKGRDHFAQMQTSGAEKIYFVADAVGEIVMGKECEDLGVIPVGFAYAITPERILEAFERLKKVELPASVAPPVYPAEISGIDFSKLVLPDGARLHTALVTAGAKDVVMGSKEDIMKNLREYFMCERIISL